MLGNPLAVLRCQLRDSSVFVSTLQLIVQHLEWLITTQDIVWMLILVSLLLGNMSKLLFHRWLLSPLSWQVFIKPRGIHQALKCESELVEHVGVMLSFMLCPNTGLI